MNEKKYFQVIDPDQRGPLATVAPNCLYLEVTNQCNLTCKTCPLTYGRVESPALLSLEREVYRPDVVLRWNARFGRWQAHRP